MRKDSGRDWSLETLLKRLEETKTPEVNKGEHMKKKFERLKIDDSTDATTLLEQRL
jgi:hypothetical protein